MKCPDELKDFLNQPFLKIITIANSLRKQNCGDRLHLCSIINARSGLCTGDCKYCAQSRLSRAKIEIYPMLDVDTIVERAKSADSIGAERFSIVTSGESLNEKELEIVLAAIERIKKCAKLKMCASLGILSKQALLKLKEAGLERYHHNIESSKQYYRKIVSSHRFEDRLRTIEFAKEVGLEVCAGGIIGMGETWEDRIEMALILKELDVDSVPLNILIPIPGTPLGAMPLMDPIDALKTVALFRYVLPNKEIRLIAGREQVLGKFQVLAFLSGANGMMIGGYLTVKGDPLERDKKLIDQILEEWTKSKQVSETYV